MIQPSVYVEGAGGGGPKYALVATIETSPPPIFSSLNDGK